MSVVTTRDFDDGTTLISINRPERKNAICAETAIQLQQAFAAFDACDHPRVAVLTGTGDEAFSGGADVAKTCPSSGAVCRPWASQPTSRSSRQSADGASAARWSSR